ncbi:MAG TPA: hypothetical protein VL147_11825 [Devosia sp.]|nr:hypothetical protein [Devosia sp.]
MRTTLLSGCFAIACIAGMPSVNAQGTGVIDGGHGADTTCSEFMALDEAAQTELLEQLQGTVDTATTTDAAGSPPSEDAEVTTAPAGDAAQNENEAVENEDYGSAEAVMSACKDDDKLTVGQAVEQTEATP